MLAFRCSRTNTITKKLINKIPFSHFITRFHKVIMNARFHIPHRSVSLNSFVLIFFDFLGSSTILTPSRSFVIFSSSLHLNLVVIFCLFTLLILFRNLILIVFVTMKFGCDIFTSFLFTISLSFQENNLYIPLLL